MDEKDFGNLGLSDPKGLPHRAEAFRSNRSRRKEPQNPHRFGRRRFGIGARLSKSYGGLLTMRSFAYGVAEKFRRPAGCKVFTSKVRTSILPSISSVITRRSLATALWISFSASYPYAVKIATGLR